MPLAKIDKAIKKSLSEEDSVLNAIQWAMFFLYLIGMLIAIIGIKFISSLWQGHYIALVGITLSIIGVVIFSMPFKEYIIVSVCSFICGNLVSTLYFL